jgi:hypothetical protein
MDPITRLRELFAEPPVEYRSAPFWAWNDELRQEELLRQIDGMKEQGMGGFFMHSRDGLETDYLGEDWMKAVAASVSRAEELGMQAWLYDEDRWPSGSAGGQVPAMGDEYRSKGLTVEVVRGEYRSDGGEIALFRAEIDGMELFRCERLSLLHEEAYAAGEKEVLLVFRIEVSSPSEWFNGEAPPDSLNPATVRQFIDRTYEVYKREVGHQFGRTIRGVFTDEPSVNDRHCKYTDGRGWIPWTYGLPAYFEEKRGYDILDVLPHIFFNSESSPMSRHDYWRTVAEKFTEAFTKQLYEWCEDNGLAFTGHFLQEDKLGLGTRVCGAMMPHYRYQHVPGIDMLCEQTDEYMTVKQCTSVANQYGRKRVITETYGCTGWEFTFEGQKWIGDWQFVLGVNWRSQHLALYSLKGCRKRDYPPVFNYNTCWWKYNYLVEDYFARIAAVMTEGEAVRDVLVLHPASTAWSMLGTNPYGMPNRGRDRDIPAINRYGDEFNRFLRALLGAHYDFDLGDETIMAETGSAAENGLLRVNRATYRLVVLPHMRTMLSSTFELLERFVQQGGRIVAVAPLAAMLEGRTADELGRLWTHPGVTVVQDTREAIQELSRLLPRRVSIRGRCDAEASELLYLLKRMDGCSTLFVANNDRGKAIEATIETTAVGKVEEWNALTGEMKNIAARVDGVGRLTFQAHFGAADSKLFVIRQELPPQARPAPQPIVFHDNDLYAAFGPSFRFTRTMPNLLTLDTCEYLMGDGEWSERMEVWQAQRCIREALGMRQIYYNGITQRYKWIRESHPQDGTPVSFKFRFHVGIIPERGVKLVVEGADQFRICLNGVDAVGGAEGWFMDRALDCIRLDGVRNGWNELVLSCSYRQTMEIEDVYLIGDFGVSATRSIVEEPAALRAGDWCLQGYFHYCGSMVYHLDFNYSVEESMRSVLELGDFSAVTVEVRVNGRTAGHIPWKAADGLDITPFLTGGSNRIDIEVMGSPRNMFGPFHLARGTESTTSWASFRTEGKQFTPDYIVEPYGLMGQIQLKRVVAQ